MIRLPPDSTLPATPFPYTTPFRSLSLTAPAAGLVAAPATAETLYVETGRLIDGMTDRVRTGQCVMIEDERITAVADCGTTPAGATRLDWSAYTVLPGLIDLHPHLAAVGQSPDLAAPMKENGRASCRENGCKNG